MNLEQMWKLNRDYIRRLLISLSRNIDLAEDLLQETYLKANADFDSYRDGDARAWLAAIAKNVFYSAARRKSYSSEVELDPELHGNPHAVNGGDNHITMINLRRAMDDLTPDLRTALLMKHYGGFSYLEIGKHLGCPEGTAKTRVWRATQKLRMILGAMDEERTAMKCSQIRSSRLLDYLYGVLTTKDADKMKQHLDTCPECRKEAEKIRKLMTSLDCVEDSFKLTRIIDIDESGVATQYDWWTIVNAFGEVMKTTWWTVNKDHCVDYITLQGEEVMIDVLPCSEKQFRYEGVLPTPVEPGGTIEETFVCHSLNPGDMARVGEDGKMHFAYKTNLNTAREWIMVLAIRLPAGARLVEAGNAPTEIRTKENTTLMWRKALPSLHPHAPLGWNSQWQFECEVVYEPDVPVSEQPPAKEPSEWAKTYLKWAPEIAFELNDFGAFGTEKAMALSLYRKAVDADLPERFYQSWFSLALGLWWSECYEEALDVFGKISKWDLVPDCERFASFVWIGQILDTLGRRGEAIESYQKALEVGLADDDYMQHGNIDAWMDNEWVKERLKTPYQRVPNEVYYLARMFGGERDEAKLTELYAGIKNYRPANWNFPADLGRLLLDCNMPDEAYEVFQTMYETAQAHPQHLKSDLAMFAALAMQGYILKMQEKHKEARRKAERALAIEVKNNNHPCIDPRATREMVQEELA